MWLRNRHRHTPPQAAQQNVQAVAHLEHDALQQRSLAERISDAITRVIGSLPFVILHLLGFVAWILLNGGVIPGFTPIDPFPFGIMTLIVSTEGVLLAIIILISQNRMVRQANRRAHLDLQVNMLAEQEMTLTLHMLRRIADHLGLAPDSRDADVQQLLEKTDIHSMVSHLEEQLPQE